MYWLSLSNNQLANLSFSTFNDLKELLILDLSSNRFTSVYKCWFTNLTGLANLYISGNPIVFIEPNVFQGLTKLYTIMFMSSNISGVFSLSYLFGNDTTYNQLVSIHLQYNKITALNLDLPFSNFPVLRTVYLFKNLLNSSSNQIIPYGNTTLTILTATFF
jgi:hypothetical protein